MITKIELENFRNIKNETYILGQKSIICGENFTGKTNILNAICWVLSGNLLDGSSDNGTIKPLNNSKAEVRVKLYFENEKTIEKRTKEKWTKTRGTSEETLTGHETKYFINDSPVPTSKALEQIKTDILGCNYQPKTSINLINMLIDPLYLFTEKTNWKQLRSFIIELVGDVKIEDVVKGEDIKDNKFLEEILNRLALNNGNLELSTKYFKTLTAKSTDEVNEINTKIEGEKSKSDVDQIDLENAKVMIDSINKNIDAKRQEKAGMVNPNIALCQEQLNKLEEEFNQVKKDDYEKYQLHVKEIDKANQDVEVKINDLRMQKNDLYEFIANARSEVNSKKMEIESVEKEIIRNESKMNELRNAYKILLTKTFNEIVLPNEVRCHHCGGIVNDEIIASIKEQEEKRKQEFLADIQEQKQKINQEGITLKDKNVQLKLKVQELMIALEEAKNKQASLETSKNEIDEKITSQSLCLKPKNAYLPGYDSNYYVQKINELKDKLSQEKNVVIGEEIDDQIADLRSQLSNYDKIISDHSYYEQTQRWIAKLESELQVKLIEKNNNEQRQMLCEQIAKKRLEMLKANVSKVFGNNEICLAESNIKEGSWNEVCYPIVKDEKTGAEVPFSNASHSQQYIQSILLVECIKRAIGATQEAPILIDEIGTLDSKTIDTRIVTDAQIIASKCDDHYNKPTVVCQ